jgi:hypothetical protein
MVHLSPFGRVNQWGMLVGALTFTPSSYIPLQIITSTPIYTMEVSNSSGRIEKFSRLLGMITLKEFKATFSTMVYELKLEYGTNYIEAFVFKQLARYVHYEALDVYKQHSPRILGVIQIPNPIYATTITISSQAALHVIIARHGTMPNNLNLVPTLVNISPQQLIVVIANNLPTIDALAFVDPMEEFFRVFELEFRHLFLVEG